MLELLPLSFLKERVEVFLILIGKAQTFPDKKEVVVEIGKSIVLERELCFIGDIALLIALPTVKINFVHVLFFLAFFILTIPLYCHVSLYILCLFTQFLLSSGRTWSY